jgi:proteasome lid subunit RPN8/RPN11
MVSSPFGVVSLYIAAALTMWGAVQMHQTWPKTIHDPLLRGLERGEVEAGIPRLDPEDAMANAALLRTSLNAVGTPGLDDASCDAGARQFSVLLDGRASTVRFGARLVCQLRRLKQISVAQPGFGRRGLGEVAAFVLGRRAADGENVDVSRVVVPPFRFTRDTVTLIDADLGGLLPGEKFLGTYHTHPEGDLEQGIPSTTDLHWMRWGYLDFHGQVGEVHSRSGDADWLFDIVEPRDGEWNVYAHDRARLDFLRETCEAAPQFCPLDELRLTGSRFYLFTRFFEQRDEG